MDIADESVIQNIKLYGDFFSRIPVEELEGLLVGVRHEPETIRAALANYDVGTYIQGMTIDDLLKNYDLMLTKSGGATLFEAISSNTPIIVKNPKVGQEIENAKFIRDKGIGILYDNDEDLKDIIKSLLNNELDSRVAFMDENITYFKTTIHPEKIGDYVFELLDN